MNHYIRMINYYDIWSYPINGAGEVMFSRAKKEPSPIAYKGFKVDKRSGNIFCAPEGGLPKFYRVGKNHYYRGLLDPCVSGLHSCLHLVSVDDYYQYSSSLHADYVICEVIPFGNCITLSDKMCSSGLYIKRKLKASQVLDLLFGEVASSNDYERAVYGLSVLYNIFSKNKGGGLSKYFRHNKIFSQKNLNRLIGVLRNLTNSEDEYGNFAYSPGGFMFDYIFRLALICQTFDIPGSEALIKKLQEIRNAWNRRHNKHLILGKKGDKGVEQT